MLVIDSVVVLETVAAVVAAEHNMQPRPELLQCHQPLKKSLSSAEDIGMGLRIRPK